MSSILTFIAQRLGSNVVTFQGQLTGTLLKYSKANTTGSSHSSAIAVGLEVCALAVAVGNILTGILDACAESK